MMGWSLNLIEDIIQRDFIDYSHDRKLHGIFEAASNGQMNIDPYCWTGNGEEKSPYPAQVRIRISVDCKPLAERQFHDVIADNYYTASHFWFELDHTQVEGLKALFVPAPSGFSQIAMKNSYYQPNPSKPIAMTKIISDTSWDDDYDKLKKKVQPQHNAWNKPLVFKNEGVELKNNFELFWDDGDEKGGSSKASFSSFGDDDTASNDGNALKKPLVLKNEEVELRNNSSVSLDDADDKIGSLSKTSSSALGDHELNQNASDWDSPDIDCPIVTSPLERKNPTSSEIPSIANVMKNDEDIVLDKLKKIVMNRAQSNSNTLSDLPCPTISSAKEIKPADHLEVSTFQLDAFEVQLEEEISSLKERVKHLEYKLDPLQKQVDESLTESLVKHYQGSDDVIYLVGGFDGDTWLSTLDSYAPSHDILTPLRPMSFARSYASAVALGGILYVFGGGDGTNWYNTVECYNPRKDVWTLCAPLNREKGSLAGATLHNKIFALGGGNGSECFSDVEVFEPALNRWIINQEMHQKRFAPAAAEFNGMIYAVGGFDGKNYLKTAERLDAREGLWANLPNMNSSRGCHSVAVLNDKLYALGGHNGINMVSTVEVFDPRASSWMMEEPMNEIRGYAGVTVLGSTIFAMGGLKDGGSIAESVEFYKEGAGWQLIKSKAIKKRCFFSAMAL
ncbi:hypothetical protein QJS10_CPA07g01212 [Acorus calamus]|uniref:DCD domain-containing protein n=1 Tax=Acorus calamus TaxID=4465 RepID=A0AAV9EHX3_ACOCL|nr:hypothetical protein QJS10_CPA07g01212 [Acorus calamus]